MKVGFIGLGKMGFPMATNLLAAGHRVTVYNRTKSRADELAARGAIVAGTPEACAGSPVVITMLSDDNALEELLFSKNKLVDALSSGAVHLCMSTISAALSGKLAEVHSKAGQIYVAAPLFEALARKTFVLGPPAAQANLVKVGSNFLLFAMIESLGEAVAFARKTGLNADEFVKIVTETVFDSGAYRVFGPMIAQGKYEPVGFPLSMVLKDIGLALQAAGHAACPLPFANVIRDQLSTAIARGYQDLDETALARIAAENAGLPL